MPYEGFVPRPPLRDRKSATSVPLILYGGFICHFFLCSGYIITVTSLNYYGDENPFLTSLCLPTFGNNFSDNRSFSSSRSVRCKFILASDEVTLFSEERHLAVWPELHHLLSKPLTLPWSVLSDVAAELATPKGDVATAFFGSKC